MIGHPREQRLLGFLEGRLPDGERRRIAAHLADCQSCRNAVQGLRAVRAVFQLEASPAPGGVLERVLTSRADGIVMVLPVADPGHGRRFTPRAIALLVGAAALALLSVVQVVPVPMRPVTDAWDWWSRTIVDWNPLGGGDGVEIPEMFVAPVATPAVVHPERLRAMTALYRTIDRRGIGERPHVDTAGFSVVAPTTRGGHWSLRMFQSADPDDYRETLLDPTSLEPWQWTRFSGQPGVWRRVLARRFERDTLFRELSYTGDVPAPFLRNDPPGNSLAVIESRHDAPIVGGPEHWYAVLTTVTITSNWSGSFAFLYGSGDPDRIVLDPTSFFVTGVDSVTTPAGRFEAWRVSSVERYGESRTQWWVRTSDGLFVKSEYRQDSEHADTRELISITYP